MNWTNIKDKWPPSNSEVVVYYYFNVNDPLEDPIDYGKWTAELMHEKMINQIDSSHDIYWIEIPGK